MDYRSVINTFKSKKILVIGDIILDSYMFGTSSRISPEAPVPVINKKEVRFCLGGAANVANNIRKLGSKVYLVGSTGNDESSKTIRKLLKESGIDSTNLIKIPSRPTTVKTRIISDNQQIVRIDDEDNSSLPKTYANQALNRISRIIRRFRPDAVIISDYNKGFITAGLAREIIKIAKRFNSLISVDPKGRDFSKYRGANIITPNLPETEDYIGKQLSKEKEIKSALKKIKKDINAGGVLITRGKKGVSFIDFNDSIRSVPTLEKQVFDVTGAGDTFISVFTLSVISSESWEDCSKIANAAASNVISRIGTTFINRDQLIFELARQSGSYTKIKKISELKTEIAERRKNGEKVVFTNGCFDILHTGHIKTLRESRKKGDMLIVALNSDSSVTKLKGRGRPLVSEDDRSALLSSFDFVDYVVVFRESTPLKTIKSLRPDVITKGGDYKRSEVVGRGFVEGYGGKVSIIPLERNRSTSLLLDKIKSTSN